MTMPELNIHEEDSLKKYGKKFTELHQWMDAPVKIYHWKHRKERHDPHETPLLAKSLFGQFAYEACLDHIIMDLDDEKNSLNNSKNISKRSKMLTVKLPIQMYQRLIEYGLFIDESKSKIVREMIANQLMELPDLTFYREFEIQIREKTDTFFKNYSSSFVKDHITLIKERDEGKCQKCNSIDNLGILHIDGNINNFKPINLITICDKCLKDYQMYVFSYTNKVRFATWLAIGHRR